MKQKNSRYTPTVSKPIDIDEIIERVFTCLPLAPTGMTHNVWDKHNEYYSELHEVGRLTHIFLHNGCLYNFFKNEDTTIKFYLRAIKYSLNRLIKAKTQKYAKKPKSFYYKKGISYLKQSNFMAAVIAFEMALYRGTVSSETLLRLGQAYQVLELYSSALNNYTLAILVNPGQKEALFRRAFIWIEFRCCQDAISDLENLLEIDPKYSSAHAQLGFVHKVLGDNNQAMKCFNKAIELNPEEESAYWNRSQLHFDAGDTKKSNQDIEKAKCLAKSNSLSPMMKLERKEEYDLIDFHFDNGRYVDINELNLDMAM